jgi:hypothetical protein
MKNNTAKLIAFVTPVLLVSSVTISHFELPVHDFVQGMLAGTGIVGSLFTLVTYGRKKSHAV